MLGTTDKYDGKYLWPDQFEHYIEEHDVIIPDYFYDHIVSNNFEPPVIPDPYDGIADLSTEEMEVRCANAIRGDSTQWNEWVLMKSNSLQS